MNKKFFLLAALLAQPVLFADEPTDTVLKLLKQSGSLWCGRKVNDMIGRSWEEEKARTIHTIYSKSNVKAEFTTQTMKNGMAYVDSQITRTYDKHNVEKNEGNEAEVYSYETDDNDTKCRYTITKKYNAKDKVLTTEIECNCTTEMARVKLLNSLLYA